MLRKLKPCYLLIMCVGENWLQITIRGGCVNGSWGRQNTNAAECLICDFPEACAATRVLPGYQ